MDKEFVSFRRIGQVALTWDALLGPFGYPIPKVSVIGNLDSRLDMFAAITVDCTKDNCWVKMCRSVSEP